MRHLSIAGLITLIAWAWCVAPAHAEPGAAAHIEWEVKNRFRLFRSEADFRRHVAIRADSVLAAEQHLARDSDGRGWARDTVERLCADRGGRLLEFCERDGERESYLSPRDHRIGVTLEGVLPAGFEACVWSFDDGDGSPPRSVKTDCIEEVKLRVRYGQPTQAAVDIIQRDGGVERVTTEIQVRDVLIAGMGNSIAAGDGNPDRAVRLSDDGFCYRRLSGAEYFRPGRAGFTGNKSCGTVPGEDPGTAEWMRQSARWMSGPCHRSLYGYQMRTALALAVEYPHIAVTFLPLACSGATVNHGFLDHQRARECPSPGSGAACPGFARAQMTELGELMTLARRQQPDRELDLVLLTIGANDIHFSGLVANIIVEAASERSLLRRGGAITTVEEAQQVLERELPGNFARLRAALKPYVGGDLARVVFVSYGNPALAGPDTPCPGGRDGFDVHPAFAADGERLRQTVDFVGKRFLPGIKSLVQCEPGTSCRDPASDRMTFVDAHQPAFANMASARVRPDDPPFDRECFSPKGETFSSSLLKGATDPLLCSYVASDFRPYAPRARWVRTANDSYLTAMTYPEGLPALLQPRDLHDAIGASSLRPAPAPSGPRRRRAPRRSR